MKLNSLTRITSRRILRRVASRIAILPCVAAAVVMLSLSGCGPDRYILATTPENVSLTGNWQITATTNSGMQPFTALTGSILQATAQSNGDFPIFWILQAVQPDSCFLGAATVPLEGNLTGSSFTLLSLSDSGQYLNVSGTKASTGATLTGSFTIDNGCANGVQGSLSGTKIAPLTGSYSGPWTVGSGANTLSLTLTQDSFADGFGYFHLHGSAAFAGLSCFSAGTVQSTGSTISGEQVQLTITTNEATPSSVLITGTLNPTATSLTLSSIQVVSGGCAGNAGTATLTS